MRCEAAAVLVLALFVTAPGLAAPVTNGGFEQVAADGTPADWSLLGDTVTLTSEAHSGARALRIEMPRGAAAPPEVGVNRAWAPERGEQGAMLSERRGGITFWYRVDAAAPNASLTVMVIPMSGKPLEDTGSPRAVFNLPAAYAGDGQWRRGKLAYDFTGDAAVRWVHVGARITGGPGVFLLDDVDWVERVGPALQVERVRLFTDPRPGRRAVVSASIANRGDAPVEGLQVRVSAPNGAVLRPVTVPRTLAVQAAAPARWEVASRLPAGAVTVDASAGSEAASLRTVFAPAFALRSVLTAPGIALPGSTVTVTATVRNVGTADGSPTLRLRPGPGCVVVGATDRPAGRVGPGEVGVVRWRLRLPRREGDASCVCSIVGAAPPVAASARATVTAALAARAEPMAGSLWVRRGTARTVGELRLSGSNRVAALLPHLGSVLARLPDGSTQRLVAGRGALRRSGSSATLTAQARDRAGGVWRFEARAARSGGAATHLSIRASCSRPREVLCFEGPTLLVGDGPAPAPLLGGIFPGLEWLAPGEASSSDLDIAADHADRLRITPHPNKVTIPAMGVRAPAGVVSLLWDTRDRWDGSRDRPQPVYAVPDVVGGAAGHRMGLVAPNVVAGLPENAVRAPKGIRLAARAPLTLRAVVVADAAARDELATVDAWFRSVKPAPALQAPRGTDARQLEWSAQVLVRTLWVSPEAGWMPFLGGPSLWRKPGFDPSYAFDLLQATRLVPAARDAARWREVLSHAGARIPAATADDHGFDQGAALDGLARLAATVHQRVAQQSDDGTWAFDAELQDTGVFRNLDYRELGPDRVVELGTCARAAYELLLYARLTGDPGAYAAGAKALKAMQRFTVPRAAQVWEVPSHSPDILAAADAVDAYLEAYRYTQGGSGKGDPRWLAEARRWARAGLPFVYVWNAPGKPWMRYGSIPVFGASWMQWSWFGNIVQWNGLRYGHALLKLHQVDPHARWGGLSWRDLAVGITRSAMYQQSVKPETFGLWPDSLHAVTDARSNWEFAPRLIAKNVYAILGRPEEPRTLVLHRTGQRVRVSTGGPALSATWTGDTVTARVRHAARQTGSVLFAGVARPAAVFVDGRPMGEDTGAGARASGWRYDAARSLLLAPVRHDGPAVVEVRGVEARPATVLVPAARRLAFEFSSGTEGWQPLSGIASLVADGGSLVVRAGGIDPYIIRQNCRFDGSGVREVVLRIRGVGDGNGELYWSTQTDFAWSEDRVIRFRFPTDGEWHEVAVPVSAHPQWRGQSIAGLRLDPGGSAATQVAIDWIRGR